VLIGTRLASADDQQDRLQAFLRSAIRASKTLLDAT